MKHCETLNCDSLTHGQTEVLTDLKSEIKYFNKDREPVSKGLSIMNSFTFGTVIPRIVPPQNSVKDF